MMKHWILPMLLLMLVFAGCGEVEDTVNTEPDSVVEAPEQESSETAEVPATEEVHETDSSVETEEVSVVEEDAKAGGDTLEESGTAGGSESAVETVGDNGVSDDADVAEEAVEADTTETDTAVAVATDTEAVIAVDEVRAIWLSYLDLLPVFDSGQGTEEDYRTYMAEVLTDMKGLGLNTLIYQVRPFGDALYPSALFPSSYIITGVEGDLMAFDPFGIAVEMAHEENIRVEAWINPYRIRTSKSTVPLSDGNTALTWYEDGSGRVLKSPEGTMVYSPASDEVQDRIVAGVVEIIELYPVDGIHFDDYFYPTTEASFDELPYLNFLHDNDAMTQEEWRRSNVNELITEVYSAVKATDSEVVFGISPDGDIDANLQYHYADVVLWMTEEGYVDYLMPQIYYGFNHGRLPYEQVLNQWHYLDEGNIELIPAIAAYKLGKEDQWAGDSGKTEWIDTEEIVAKMIETAMDQPSYAGFALYRYGSLFEPSEELSDRIERELDAILLLGEDE